MPRFHFPSSFLLIPTLACVVAAWDRSAPATPEKSNQKSTSLAGSSDAKVRKSHAEWRKILTGHQYEITRLRGTERAFTGAYWNHKASGSYRCVCCSSELFSSDHKFESGTGWPSFSQAARENCLEAVLDRRHRSVRVEVRCRRCDAHLGHVFNDGPAPTGMRFCINSASLKFAPRNSAATSAATEKP